ncbi:MAG: MFS transporter [Methylobacteriaceae bacterium]|nr:MFS transporter [Methylobacteriaceae bacterium]
MSSTSGEAAPRKLERAASGGAVIVAALVGIYMLSQFFRNALGVIGPDLARAFDLDAARLGFLSSIFFLSFALAQIPLGMAIDRWGPRPTMLATAALMIASTVLFAFARNYFELAAARALMGLGCCSFLMAPLALYAERFPPAKFSTITGIHIGGGSFGMLAATAPLAWLAGSVGWRNSFLTAAVIATVMATCVFLFAREAPETLARRRARSETLGEAAAGVVAATRIPGFWRMFFIQAAAYSAFASIIGLWIGPWLAQVYGLPLESRGRMTLILAVAQIAGLFFWGASDRWFASYRRPALVGILLALATLAVGALVALPAAALPAFMAAFGFFFGITPVLTAQGKALFPRELTGRGMTLINTGVIGGAFAQQAFTGFVIEAFGAKMVAGVRTYPPEAFRLVFGLLALQLAVALYFYLRAPDLHPERD